MNYAWIIIPTQSLHRLLSLIIRCFIKLDVKKEANWAVIILDVEKVLNLECAFCYTNAANSEITSIP